MSNMDMHLRHTATARFQHQVLIMGTKTFYLHLTTNPKPQTSITGNSFKKKGQVSPIYFSRRKGVAGHMPKVGMHLNTTPYQQSSFHSN
jgi:hypothetical protein